MIKIRYETGEVADAATLSRTESSMRLALAGADDVLALKRISGDWMTEPPAPVIIACASACVPTGAVAEEECICPADLATRLIGMLYAGNPEEESGDPDPSPESKVCAPARVA